MAIEFYDDVKITYKDGRVEYHPINVSTMEGCKKRDKLIKKAQTSKMIDSYDVSTRRVLTDKKIVRPDG